MFPLPIAIDGTASLFLGAAPLLLTRDGQDDNSGSGVTAGSGDGMYTMRVVGTFVGVAAVICAIVIICILIESRRRLPSSVRRDIYGGRDHHRQRSRGRGGGSGSRRTDNSDAVDVKEVLRSLPIATLSGCSGTSIADNGKDGDGDGRNEKQHQLNGTSDDVDEAELPTWYVFPDTCAIYEESGPFPPFTSYYLITRPTYPLTNSPHTVQSASTHSQPQPRPQNPS